MLSAYSTAGEPVTAGLADRARAWSVLVRDDAEGVVVTLVSGLSAMSGLAKCRR
jgi:hypothetical protein